jgi:hypothetical protein
VASQFLGGPETPFCSLVAEALRADYAFFIVPQFQPRRLLGTGPHADEPQAGHMNEVARHLLGCELLGQLPPAAAGSMIKRDLWAAFEWQRTLGTDDKTSRHKAQRFACYRLFYALRDALDVVSRSSVELRSQKLQATYRLPTFLALLERLVTQMVFASGCVGNCYPPLLPSRYVAAYLAPRTSLVSPYLLFNDNKPVAHKLYRDVLAMVTKLLPLDGIFNQWASIGTERQHLQAVQASLRTRCYVLVATVLLNRVSIDWETERMHMMQQAVQMDGGNARSTWAKAHVEYANCKSWINDAVQPFLANLRSQHVPTKPFFDNMTTLINKLSMDVVCLKFPWTCKGGKFLPNNVRVIKSDGTPAGFEQELRVYLGIQIPKPSPEASMSTGTSAKQTGKSPPRNGRRTEEEEDEEGEKEDEAADAQSLPPAPPAELVTLEEEQRRREQERKEKETAAMASLDLLQVRRRAAEAFWAKKHEARMHEFNEAKGEVEAPTNAALDMEGIDDSTGAKMTADTEGMVALSDGEYLVPDRHSCGSDGEAQEGQAHRYYLNEVMALMGAVEAVGSELVEAKPGSKRFQAALASWPDAPSLEADILDTGHELSELSESLAVEVFVEKYPTLSKMMGRVNEGKALLAKVEDRFKPLLKRQQARKQQQPPAQQQRQLKQQRPSKQQRQQGSPRAGLEEEMHERAMGGRGGKGKTRSGGGKARRRSG